MSESLIGVVTTVTLSVGSLFVGMAAANAQQDRAAIRQQKAVARALLADLRRIDNDLLAGADVAGAAHHTNVIAPAIHPWVEGLITQAAESAPAVIEGYMALQRLLVQLGQARGNTAAWRDSAWGAEVNFPNNEAQRRTQYDRGIYDPTSDRNRPPVAALPGVELQLDEEPSPSLDEAQATYLRGNRDDRRHIHFQQTGLAKSVVKEARAESLVAQQLSSLRALLIPVAERRIRSIPALAWRMMIPMPEDAEIEPAAERTTLRSRTGEMLP